MIRTAAVLGAGTMGAQIAAHLGNAGLDVHLLDLTRAVAAEGLERARRLKPDPFVSAQAASRIRLGGFDEDLERACVVDWIVEAVVERLDVKQSLLSKVDPHRLPTTIVSTNTSGIPIGAIAQGTSAALRRHFLGTHFFNPPRYLKLLEVIPTPDTDAQVIADVSRFADLRLGKGVVVAKDTPNFIANHLGLFGVLRILDALTSGNYTIEEIDAITGPALGRPKSATFRTLDLTGLDILLHVSRNLVERIGPAAASAFLAPPLIEDLVSRGWVGEKAGQGFYRREKRNGDSEILTLDPASMTYRPRQSPRLAALDAVKAGDVAARVKTLFAGRDRVGDFLRATLGPTLVYAARVTPEIAHSIDDVDRAMQWGYGWELGPFELVDAIGIRELLDASGADGVPPLLQEQLDAGRNTLREGRRVPSPPGAVALGDVAGQEGALVKKNPGASLIDLADGVLALSLHSKMNTIGGDTVAMMTAAVKEAERQFAALIVATDAQDFSVGANLMLLLLEAQEGNWDEIDAMVRGFQQANMALRSCGVPVVVAIGGRVLGGGCEIALHGDRVQAACETYMGLVEAGVGLIPAGGGTKEMIFRSSGHLAPGIDLLPPIQRVFETLGFAVASSSAADARTLGFLRDADRISMNRDRLVGDAKTLALALAQGGYQPPAANRSIVVGGAPLESALKLGVHLAWRAGRISDHDARIGRALARVLAGGPLPQSATVSEQYLLDLEREAFLSLCGEPRTLERMQHTLKTGKPLRN